MLEKGRVGLRHFDEWCDVGNQLRIADIDDYVLVQSDG